MFKPSNPDATASTFGDADFLDDSSSSPQYETVRHHLYGRPSTVQAIIKRLYKLNYAEPNEWSKPIPTGRPHEVMVVLTKKVRLG
ncbi:MAG: hypothetical protein AAGD25_36355 [Cyanobacteria bacterium P01_F01_bin.150]